MGLFSLGSRRGPSEDKAREGQRPPVSEEREQVARESHSGLVAYYNSVSAL